MKILIIFAVTGSSTMFIKKIIIELFNINFDLNGWVWVILYIILITPVYFTLLLAIALIFGQFRFFLAFEKKIIQKLGSRLKRRHK